MGMFDSITVSYPGVRPGRYQTKDLVCELDEYELRHDGRLVSVHQFDSDEQKQIIFTGTGEVCFYNDFDEGTGWTEYSAYFSKGKLLHLEQTSPANAKTSGPTTDTASTPGVGGSAASPC
jgi:hypothetical protein